MKRLANPVALEEPIAKEAEQENADDVNLDAAGLQWKVMVFETIKDIELKTIIPKIGTGGKKKAIGDRNGLPQLPKGINLRLDGRPR